MAVHMYIANKSTEGESLMVTVHPEAGGTDRVKVEPNKAFIIRDVNQTLHFEVEPHVPGVEQNIMSVEDLDGSAPNTRPAIADGGARAVPDPEQAGDPSD